MSLVGRSQEAKVFLGKCKSIWDQPEQPETESQVQMLRAEVKHQDESGRSKGVRQATAIKVCQNLHHIRQQE